MNRLLLVMVSTALLLPCARSADAATQPASLPATSEIHWEKWSDDVFARAARDHKFVLLDLQAVWCHWCHVMDDITYSDPKVIDLISSRYIAVQVDQDSRPDLSNRYEDYGWPATIVFNSDGSEIVKRSGYIPPRPMASMLQAIIDDPSPGPSVRPEKAFDYAKSSALGEPLCDALWKKLDSAYDDREGGWGTIHKFVDWDAVELCMASADERPRSRPGRH